MDVRQARDEYQAAALKHAELEERYDAIEQMPDREAELRWDARLEASEQRLKEAADRLRASGGRTLEEAQQTRPSERFIIRSLGDRFGLGETWEVYDPEFEMHVESFGSEDKAKEYLVKADAKWQERQDRKARREEVK